MPSPQATALTRSHRSEIGIVAGLAARQVIAVARRADPADIDAWWDRALAAVLRIVTLAAGVTATLTVRYLRQHAALEGVQLKPVRAVPEVGKLTTSLRVMGPVAFKTHMRNSGSESASLLTMVTQLAGTASSRVVDGNRDTVMATFAEQDQMVGWRRVTSGKPCTFCLALASRGGVYSKDTVSFLAHKPRCFCTPEPLYRHEPEPAEVLALREQWEQATEGLSGRDALNAFRRAQAK